MEAEPMSTTIPSTEQHRQVIERFLAALERGDVAGAAELADPDIAMEWPQSGERFRGRANALAAMNATEVKPELAGEPSMIGSGDVWVIRMPVRYGSELFQYAGIFELRGGLICRTTEFFAAPFPANPARAPYAEPEPGMEDTR
jgi:ketosteroid isomerase-like protein